MLLKLKLLGSDAYFGSPMRFERLGDDESITVTLRSPEKDEQDQGIANQTVCEASAELKPSERVLETFEALWHGRIPSGVDLSEVPEHIRAPWKPGYLQNYEIPLSRLSQGFQDFLRQSTRILMEAMQRVVAMACWRAGEPCLPHLYRHGRIVWSLDGNSWRMAPVNIVMWDERPVFLSDLLRDQIDNLLRQDIREPLGQE
jgi:hypothetical protein